jgi:predicted enzyme related to lactoylglutathione lyase
MNHIIHWVVISTTNIFRAKYFYSTLLDIEMNIIQVMCMRTAFFPHAANSQSGGCLMEGPYYIPSDKGSIIYLNVGKNLQQALKRVETAGGSVILPKTAIEKNRFMAHFLDTEGNKVGLYSKK